MINPAQHIPAVKALAAKLEDSTHNLRERSCDKKKLKTLKKKKNTQTESHPQCSHGLTVGSITKWSAHSPSLWRPNWPKPFPLTNPWYTKELDEEM